MGLYCARRSHWPLYWTRTGAFGCYFVQVFLSHMGHCGVEFGIMHNHNVYTPLSYVFDTMCALIMYIVGMCVTFCGIVHVGLHKLLVHCTHSVHENARRIHYINRLV